MNKAAIVLTSLLYATSAGAGTLSLNDVPDVIQKLRRCGVVSCVVNKGDVWVAIESEGKVVIFYKSRNAVDVTGRGNTLDEALRSLASKLNGARDDTADAVKAIGDLLPTQ